MASTQEKATLIVVYRNAQNQLKCGQFRRINEASHGHDLLMS
jgi:hypothetical protein